MLDSRDTVEIDPGTGTTLRWTLGYTREEHETTPVPYCRPGQTRLGRNVEAYLNHRPLVPMTSLDGDGVEALIPGHFQIRRPLCAMPEVDQLIPTL